MSRVLKKIHDDDLNEDDYQLFVQFSLGCELTFLVLLAHINIPDLEYTKFQLGSQLYINIDYILSYNVGVILIRRKTS